MPAVPSLFTRLHIRRQERWHYVSMSGVPIL
jgi:hypothetical protein